jgi:aryl-alcohol dehydrogenase-like predicted oxidoreductase
VKIALGTVQFGQNYGVANQSGQVDQPEIDRILDLARKSGIDTLDTAIAYGDSEARLGAAHVQDFRLVTKLPALPAGVEDVKRWVLAQLHASRERLQVGGLYGVLCHDAADWFGGHAHGLHDALAEAKTSGLVTKIGVSIYDPSILGQVLAQEKPDLVQAPMNVLDRRLADSGWLDRLCDAGVEIHARSIFLQGLLLMEREHIPPRFARWSNLWTDWHDMLKEVDISPIQACLWHVLSNPHIDRAVVGVDSHAHLKQLVDVARELPRPLDLSKLRSEDMRLLTPSMWTAL